MISVQNLPQPLNGNKYFLILATCILLLQACSSKQAGGTLTPIVAPNIEKKVDSDTVKLPEPEAKPEDEAKKDPLPEPVQQTAVKISHNIAVVLPFSIHQVPLDFNPYFIDTNVFLSEELKASLDFYMGLKMASDDYQHPKTRTNIFILDDANNSATVKKALQSRPFPDVDVIIGAKQASVAKELLNFARARQIPVVSPFLNELSEKTPYPQFYGAARSLKTEILVLASQAQQKFPEKDVIVLYDEQSDSSKQILKLAREVLGEKYQVAVKAVDIQTDHVNETIDRLVTAGEKVFLIALFRENLVKDIIQKVAGISTPLLLLGMSNWQYMRQPDWSAAKPHSIGIAGLTRTLSGKNRKEFEERFIQEFGVEVNETTLMGYDLGLYILSLLDANEQLKFPPSTDLSIRNMLYQFRFEPVFDEQGNVLQYKNTALDFLRWQQNMFSRD
jgi:ABC-type branched-subunit amino acid transport system substrate-binding protein